MKTLIASTIVLLATAVSVPAELRADDFTPTYSLDSFSHPYRFTPAWGHASQNPGSPKWFAPGYGYRIPGFGNSPRLSSLAPPSYKTHPFGNRASVGFGTQSNRHHYWSGSQPWYLPGAPAAVNGTAFRW